MEVGQFFQKSAQSAMNSKQQLKQYYLQVGGGQVMNEKNNGGGYPWQESTES